MAIMRNIMVYLCGTVHFIFLLLLFCNYGYEPCEHINNNIVHKFTMVINLILDMITYKPCEILDPQSSLGPPSFCGKMMNGRRDDSTMLKRCQYGEQNLIKHPCPEALSLWVRLNHPKMVASLCGILHEKTFAAWNVQKTSGNTTVMWGPCIYL